MGETRAGTQPVTNGELASIAYDAGWQMGGDSRLTAWEYQQVMQALTIFAHLKIKLSTVGNYETEREAGRVRA